MRRQLEATSGNISFEIMIPKTEGLSLLGKWRPVAINRHARPLVGHCGGSYACPSPPSFALSPFRSLIAKGF